jgi:cytochrome c-type biogenesis protein CcmH/NrfG
VSIQNPVVNDAPDTTDAAESAEVAKAADAADAAKAAESDTIDPSNPIAEIPDEAFCTEQDIVNSIAGVIAGDMTLAELEGVDAEELYQYADLGYDAFEQGRYSEAATVFAGLTAYDPTDAYFSAMRGAIAQKQGAYVDAVDHYRAALQIEPGNLYAWSNLGEALLHIAGEQRMAGHEDAASTTMTHAAEALRKAIELDADGSDVAGLRARLLVQTVCEMFDGEIAEA